MNIVIAIDSFKGSLSSIEAGNITAAAIRDILPEASTQVFPLADGGEGTVDALTAGFGGRIVKTLRLYSARASSEFDIEIFNRGDYVRAV